MSNLMLRRGDRPIDREWQAMRNWMDRFFDNTTPARWLRGFDDLAETVPAVDVEERADVYIVRAALPGWKPEEIELTYLPGALRINSLVAPEAEPEKDVKVLRREIVSRGFATEIALPAELLADKATAEFKHGILTVTLPKSEAVKPKPIRIASA